MSQPARCLAEPADAPDRVGVLVLSGSSGAVPQERCRVLAAAGATALAIQWFGGPGQRSGVDLVPLESFEEALAELHDRCERLVVMGTSRGAEAALLLGVMHPEIDAVVGLAPSDVVWAALTRDRPQRSSWTRGGEPLPFVPYDDDWEPDPTDRTDPPAYVGMYESALERYADRVPAARIPVERIDGAVVLVAGEDDALWPSATFADAIAERRDAAGRATTVVVHPEAGHRVVLPGESPQPPRRDLAHGGSPDADRALGARAWPHLLAALHLRDVDDSS